MKSICSDAKVKSWWQNMNIALVHTNPALEKLLISDSLRRWIRSPHTQKLSALQQSWRARTYIKPDFAGCERLHTHSFLKCLQRKRWGDKSRVSVRLIDRVCASKSNWDCCRLTDEERILSPLETLFNAHTERNAINNNEFVVATYNG